jgi:hypothetical protein
MTVNIHIYQHQPKTEELLETMIKKLDQVIEGQATQAEILKQAQKLHDSTGGLKGAVDEVTAGQGQPQ